jgi:hypothetical protein
MVRGNLVTLSLPDQVQALDAHIKKIDSGVELRIKWGNCANEARAFLTANSGIESLGVAQLTLLISRSKIHVTSLTEAYSHVHSNDLVDLRSRTEALKTRAEETFKGHQKRAKTILNSEIKTPEDIAPLQTELRALSSIFDGCANDVSDFSVLQKWLQRFEQDVSRLRGPDLTPDDFRKLAKVISKEAKGAQTDDDELPWDIEETYEQLVQVVENGRNTLASEWMAAHVPNKKKIEALEARDAQRLRTFLQVPPTVLTKEQLKKVEEAVVACEVRLDEMQVDGLLAKFESLSDTAKREFIKRAEKLLSKKE